MAIECSTQSCGCETKADVCSTSSEASCPACGTSCGGDPVACATAMWGQSFFHAMKAAQVEILKVKIQKAWGSKMERAADAVLETMGVKWQSMLAEVKAKADLRAKLQGLWQEGQK